MDWRVCVLASVASTSGCATVPSPALDSDPATLDTRNVCRLRSAAVNKGNSDVFGSATNEIEKRGINVQQCYDWLAEDEAAKQVRYQKIKNGLIATAVSTGVQL
jgi:hypothetical protein